jgi:hypothetical protein
VPQRAFIFLMSSQLEKAEWDETKDRFILKALRKQAHLGKRAESGFKKEAWTAVVNEYNRGIQPSKICIVIMGKNMRP